MAVPAHHWAIDKLVDDCVLRCSWYVDRVRRLGQVEGKKYRSGCFVSRLDKVGCIGIFDIWVFLLESFFEIVIKLKILDIHQSFAFIQVVVQAYLAGYVIELVDFKKGVLWPNTLNLKGKPIFTIDCQFVYLLATFCTQEVAQLEGIYIPP